MKWPVWTMIAGAAGFIIGVVSHNLISAAYKTEEPVFLIIATIISPIIFVVGLAGYIVYAVKSRY